MILFTMFIIYAIGLSAILSRRGYRENSTGAVTAPAGHHPTRILIVGATGGTGRHLVTRALHRGYEVTAFVRDPGKLIVSHPKLTVVQGNVLGEASVDKAIRGQDAVLSALGHKQFLWPTRILSRGTENVLRSMRAHGVRRLICETSLGLGDSAGRMGLYYTLFVIPVVLPFYFWDKARQERLLGASDREWVIVRPGVLTNGEPRGSCHHDRRAGGFVGTARITRADVADFMLDQLTSDAYLRTAVGIRQRVPPAAVTEWAIRSSSCAGRSI